MSNGASAKSPQTVTGQWNLNRVESNRMPYAPELMKWIFKTERPNQIPVGRVTGGAGGS
jgi:hypothetical protein